MKSKQINLNFMDKNILIMLLFLFKTILINSKSGANSVGCDFNRYIIGNIYCAGAGLIPYLCLD